LRDEMPLEEFSLIREALAKGQVGTLRKYLDRRIVAFTDAKDVTDDIRPLADRMVQLSWTIRKVADLDEGLALSCLEDSYEVIEWLLHDFKAGLARIRG